MSRKSIWQAAYVLSAICCLVYQARADITSGLLYHWPLDEISGVIAADVVSGNSGTLANWGMSEDRWVTGKVGGALDFGDIDNYVITDSPISLDQYTISFWLKVKAEEGTNPRIIGPSDGLHHWVVIGNEDNLGVGFYYDHGAVLVQDPNPPILGEWEHYAVILDRVAGQASIYRDATLVSSGSFTDDLPLESWIFGHQGDVNNHGDSLNGLLDDIRIYNRLLEFADVVELAAIPEPSTSVMLFFLIFQSLVQRPTKWRVVKKCVVNR